MRIIYFCIGHVSSGVQKKLEDKTVFLNRAGLDVELCLVAPEENAKKSEFSSLLPVDQRRAQKISRWPLIWRLSVVLEQMMIYRAIASYLETERFDFLLFRYPIADYFFWRFIKRNNGKVVTEHNSLEERELKIRQANSFYFRYFFWSERLFGKKVRSLMAAMIGVTPEITEGQAAMVDSKIPTITISNGMDVARVPVRKGNPFAGKELNLLLLAGSAAPWHGVDVLLDGIKHYRGEVEIRAFIAGNVAPQSMVKAQELSNVTFLPTQTGEALDQLVDHCHLGIGSIGFGDSFLKQASTLKVREYWSRGMPFVLGYDDADLLDNADMMPYYFRIRNNNTLDMTEVISFASRVYAIPDCQQKIRELAFRQIDYKVKANAYVEFFNSLKR